MNVHDLLGSLGPILDAAVVIGLAATWLQLRRDPTVAWREYEERLRELQESLRLLVVQAEGEARDLDRRLAAHAEQLGELTASERRRARDGAATERSPERAGKSSRPPKEAPRAADDGPRITPLAAAMAAAGATAAAATSTAVATAAPSASEGAIAPRRQPPASAPAPSASLAERVQQLAAARTPIAEIARRLSLPIAEARVLAGLTTGGLGFGAAAPAAPGRAPGARAAGGAIAS
jgi:hypothetical protein